MSKGYKNSGSGDRPKLSDVIKKSLEQKNQSSFKLCSQLGIPHAQFAEAINGSSSFPLDQRLFLILSTLGIPNGGYQDDSSFDDLQNRYEVTFKRRYSARTRPPTQFSSLPELLKNIQNLPPSIHKSFKEFSAEIEHSFSLFQESDVFIYASANLLPYEMTAKGMMDCAKWIAPVALKGAYFIYFFPTFEAVRKCANSGIPLNSDLEEIFTGSFLPALKRSLPKDTPPEVKDRIEQQVLMLTIPLNPFFAVDHKFALYKVTRTTPPVDETFCLGLSPLGNQDNAFIVPLSPVFMEKFSGFAAWQLQEAADKLNNNPDNIYLRALNAFKGTKT